MPAALIESTCEEIAAAIYRVRLPLPFALNHVNCYLLRDADGWTILDAGLNRPEIYAGWQAAFAGLGIAPTAIRRIIITHMHPDHIGMAGRLQQETGAAVFLSPGEWAIAQATWAPNPQRETEVTAYLHRVGAPPTVGAIVEEQEQRLRRMTQPLPVDVQMLHPGDTLTLAGRRCEILHAPGHAEAQIIFYAPAERLLLCGDHVLQRITPNIGYWPSSQPDPLGRYLASLNELMALPVLLALPGHGSVMTTEWQARLCALEEHHRVRLEETRRAVEGGATALEVSRRLFNYGKLSEHEVRFAVAEAMAHLDYLARRGVITFSDNGVRHYRN